MKTTVSAQKFAVRISDLTPRLMRGMLRTEQIGCGDGEITINQLWALGYLQEHGESPVKAISKAVGLKLPATSGLIDRMVQAGFVQRTRSREDRRVVLVTPTTKGRKILKDMLEKKAKSLISLFSPLSPAERAQYLELLEKVVKRMDDQ